MTELDNVVHLFMSYSMPFSYLWKNVYSSPLLIFLLSFCLYIVELQEFFICLLLSDIRYVIYIVWEFGILFFQYHLNKFGHVALVLLTRV